MDKLADYTKIAVVAFVGIFVINRALSALGLSQYRTN